jgi:hypothetical protein
MQRNKTKQCTCNHYSPTLTRLQSIEHIDELMAFYLGLGLSGERTVNWILDELLFHRTGKLFNYRRKEIPIDDDASITDKLFKKAPARTINRLIEMARTGRKRPLQKRMVDVTMMMGFGREIHLCRTSGVCSGK